MTMGIEAGQHKVLMLLTSDFVISRYEELRSQQPGLQIITELGAGLDPEVTALFAFKLPPGIAARLPNLKLAASVGAGADGLLSAEDLPEHVRVTRVVEPGLGTSMAQFVALQILAHFRSFRTMYEQHMAASWKRLPVPNARDVTVGVMGLGSIGSVVAKVLMELGFNVVGWTRSNAYPRIVSEPLFVGAADLDSFLSRCNYLVCLLPLTAETIALLNYDSLAKLPLGSYVINVSRGGIIIEPDLLRLIDEGHLSGASVDVFETEPLPAADPLWRHDKVMVTPHIAAQPSVVSAVTQFIENLTRLDEGEPLLGEVNRAVGY